MKRKAGGSIVLAEIILIKIQKPDADAAGFRIFNKK